MRNWILVAATASLLAALHIELARRWVAVDVQPAHWDTSVHLGTALDYRQAWRDGRWLDLLLTKPRPGHPQYPPIYHYTLAPVLGHERPQAAVAWLNLLYLALLAGAAGWMAWRLNGPAAAAATLVVLSLSPRHIHVFRDAFPDLALTAWVAVAYALILKSDFFRERRASQAAGLAVGLALLSKWGAVIYLLPAAAAGLQDRDRRKNLAWAVGLAALAAAPWYLVNLLPMIPRVLASVTLGHDQGNPLTWTWANWAYYPRYLAECFSAPGLTLMLAGAGWALWKSRGAHDAARPRWVLAGWAAFSYLFCTLVPSKDPRYILPAATALPILAFARFPAPALAASAALALYHGRNPRRPDPGDWRLAEMLEAVESRREPGRRANLCLLANHRALSPTTMAWTARHLGFQDIHTGGYQSEIPEWSDFVLVKTGADPGSLMSKRTHRLLASIERKEGLFPKVFKPARSFPLPDGSQAVLYEVRKDYPAISKPRRFSELTLKNAKLKDVRITPEGPGRYTATAAEATIEKLPAPIRGLRVELAGARLAEHGGKVYILRAESVRLLSASLRWDELARALKLRSGLAVSLSAEDGVLRLSAAPLPVELSVGVRMDGPRLRVDLKSLRVDGLRLPGLGAGYERDLLARPPNQPFDLGLDPIRLTKEGFSIGA